MKIAYCGEGGSRPTAKKIADKWSRKQNAISGEECRAVCVGGWCFHVEWCLKLQISKTIRPAPISWWAIITASDVGIVLCEPFLSFI